MRAVILLCSTLLLSVQLSSCLNVIWSINAGGDKFTDSNGVTYKADTLTIGESSDFGRSQTIRRVPERDQVLYQTERYHQDDFSYHIPLKDDGDYVLVLKFSEVYFSSINQKVFNVRLNDEHEIVEDLDIFEKVGRGAAHDEIVPFKIRNKNIIVDNRKSPISGGKVPLTFVKGYLDNPKINAAYVIKGKAEDVPSLEPVFIPEELPDEEEMEPRIPEPVDTKKRKHSSGPKLADPYASADQSAMFIPIAVVVGAFVPLIYCLCKI